MKTIYESESTPKKDGFYMPGEYEEQERTWILWPHRSDVWRCGAKPAQKVFTEIIKTVARFQPITVGVNTEDFPAVCEIFDGVENVRVIHMEYNDSWIRDPGPAFLVNDNGEVALSHFHFNAYGGFIDGLYFPWDKDASIGLQVAQLEQVNRYRPEDYILEGGSFNCDGQGTVVTTEMCLLNEDRNPQYTKEQIEEKLSEYLGIEKVIWIKDVSIRMKRTVMWTTSHALVRPARSAACGPMIPTISSTRSARRRTRRSPCPRMPRVASSRSTR